MIALAPVTPSMTEGRSVDLNELKELISLLEDSKLSELEIEEDGRRVRLTKQSETYVTMPAPMQMQAPMPAPAPRYPASTAIP